MRMVVVESMCAPSLHPKPMSPPTCQGLNMRNGKMDD